MSDEYSEMNKATNYVIWNGLKILATILVILGVVTGIWWMFKPVEVAVDREVAVESHQYQEARKEAQIILEQEIARLDADIARTEDPDLKDKLIKQRQALILRHARETAKLRK